MCKLLYRAKRVVISTSGGLFLGETGSAVKLHDCGSFWIVSHKKLLKERLTSGQNVQVRG
jgi:hypothetical protein